MPTTDRPAPHPLRAFVAQVEAMAGYGIPEEDIASVLNIPLEEMKRDYASELTNGHVKANAKVAENLYRESGRRRPRVRDSGDLLAQDPRRLEGDLQP